MPFRTQLAQHMAVLSLVPVALLEAAVAAARLAEGGGTGGGGSRASGGGGVGTCIVIVASHHVASTSSDRSTGLRDGAGGGATGWLVLTSWKH